MASPTVEVTESEILSHAIETIDRNAWDHVAPVVSKLRLPARDLDRVDRLLEKNRKGTLTATERTDLEKYLRVGDFLDLMRARALREIDQKPKA